MGKARAREAGSYPRLREIDGSHPLKQAAPGAYVEYAARRRRDGEVAYFNFALAREMGLIAGDHPDRLTRELRTAILETFSLVIVNEYDQKRGTRIPARDLLPNTYIATRYLQLQHRDRRGGTSGDGRSVWNGCVTHRGVTWDITSCGTGVTQLCPATAETGRFFKTGSRVASYGCGTATLEEGLGAALTSETFYRNGIATERVLACIALPGGQAINVRAGPNLLRPSHFFVHLKRADLPTLKATIDCFIERQIANGAWPELRSRVRRYRHMAEELARVFARISATFESEYIFCWMEWDGDNILANGGIIDYGSVRQFGLYHREYRFDDVERMSTTVPEQRRKARYIVQTFAQVRDFLISGYKTPLDSYRGDEVLDIFDREFSEIRSRLLLRNLGLQPELAATLLRRAPEKVERLRRAHRYFERARTLRGSQRVADGITWNAIFSTRDLLRELPERYRSDMRPLPFAPFLEIAASSYASRRDRRATPYRRRMATEFQRAYLDVVRAAARISGRTPTSLLEAIALRSAVINRFDRITGDSATYAARRLLRSRGKLSVESLGWLIERFVAAQDLSPPDKPGKRGAATDLPPDVKRILDALLELVAELRHGL